MQNYTFGGKTNIKGSKLEKFVKKDNESRAEVLQDSYMDNNMSNQLVARVGSAAYSRRASGL